LALLARYEESLRCFEEALKLDPQIVEAWTYRATTLVHLKRFEEALQCCDRALQLRADSVDAWCNRGNALAHMGLHEPSRAAYQQAITYDPTSALAWSNLGLALTHLQRTEEALVCYDKALELKPDFAQAWAHRGNAFHAQEQSERACEAYDRALSFDQNAAETHWNKSLALLRMGHFEKGWKAYEWRKTVDKVGWAHRQFAQAAWDGQQDLAGKTILLHFEQGFGDTLQFCRYVPLVARLGARVILEVQTQLVQLMGRLEGAHHVVGSGQSLPDFDLHCALLSLPMAMGTTLSTIPASIPYLTADPEQVAAWRTRLGQRLGQDQRPKVGWVWSGSPTHSNDAHRSIRLAKLLAAMPSHVHHVSLQKEVRPQDGATLQAHPELVHFGEDLHSFSDTAALCCLMDVVVSVDTSVAHLAAALGRPVILLLPANPDWRWMTHRTDTPWYPNMTLLRQAGLGQWDSVLAQVPHMLGQMLPSGPLSTSHHAA
jgi:Tfp pilus assembly protein PilF